MKLGPEERRIAREIALMHLRGAPVSARLPLECGAFVRLRKGRELRGFHGVLTPMPAAEAIVRAVDLACTDPRVAVREADALDLWLTGPPRPLEEVSSLDPGRHGLFVRRHEHRGVHLPCLAAGQDREAYLGSACVAAGLHPTWWREDAEIEVLYFEVEEA